MLRDRGTWCASRSCWLNTVACSLERRHARVTMDVTHDGIYSWERWEAHRAHDHERSEMQLEQWNLIIVTSSLLLPSCRRLCSRDRDYVRSWRVSCAAAQQRYCTADIHNSCLHEEVLITVILTTNMIVRKAEVMAVLHEPRLMHCAGVTEWLCWSECTHTHTPQWQSEGLCQHVSVSVNSFGHYRWLTCLCFHLDLSFSFLF